MRGVYAISHRVEEEQIQRLQWLQDRLAADGIRALLVRHLRLALSQNRYDPPEHGGPVLMAGGVRVTAGSGFQVEYGSRTADFLEVDETADYVGTLLQSHA